MPVRESRHDPNIGNINGWFPSRKMGFPIPFESYLEYCCIMIFEFLTVVSSYDVQPFSTHYQHPETKRKRKYTPDIEALILGDDTPHIIEVKPLALLDMEKYAPISKHIVSDLDMRFAFITDYDVLDRNLLSNVFDLHYHSRYAVSEMVQEGYEEALANRCLTIGELAYQILPKHPEKAFASILRLMWDGRIGCDIKSEEPFTSQTPIWLAKDSDVLERDKNVFTQICSSEKI
ncbi:MAG: hypothetical protein AAF846_24670 [Chloroflexota bacterium]